MQMGEDCRQYEAVNMHLEARPVELADTKATKNIFGLLETAESDC